jgi:hypothetical protein
VKVGLDALLGLIPGVGDVGSAAVGAYLLRAAVRLGVPSVVIARMLLNVLIDTVIGLIPFVGDLLDVLYRANAKNARLIVEAVEDRRAAARGSWLKLIGAFLVFALIVGGGIVGTVFALKALWNAVDAPQPRGRGRPAREHRKSGRLAASTLWGAGRPRPTNGRRRFRYTTAVLGRCASPVTPFRPARLRLSRGPARRPSAPPMSEQPGARPRSRPKHTTSRSGCGSCA